MLLPTVALVGNPNTGKTTLFNALAGMKQRVGNYPGVTVETKKGKFRHQEHVFEVIDLPGTYSLAPRSPDEMVAVSVILGQQPGEPRPDVVVAIVDASNLDRNLYLMTQVLDSGTPVVVALNMVDVAESQGLKIDVAQLSRNLGVPVVPMQANKGKGLEELKHAIAQAVSARISAPGPAFPEAFEKEVVHLAGVIGDGVPPFLVRRALLDVGGHTESLLTQRVGERLAPEIQNARQRLAQAGCPVPAVEARTRYGWIRQATQGCVQRPAHRHVTWTDHIDRVLTHKIWGTLFFLVLMFVVFQAIYTWAGPFMDLIAAGQGALGEAVAGAMEPGPLRSLLVDGVIGGVGGVVIFLPQILILFAFIAVLEDCGYMARAAFLMDKLMSRCGLNGKSFIPMLSSIACAIPGIMAARVIENRRDRLATIVVAPLMSCSARLPVYMLLIGAFLSERNGFAWWVPGVTLFALYCIGIIVAPLVAFVLKGTLLRGETPAFVLEMPLYKVPSPRLIAHRSLESGWMFIRRAGTIILASMIVVWALLYFPATIPDGDLQGRSYDVVLAELDDALEAPRARREQAAKGIEEIEEEARAGGETDAHRAAVARLEDDIKKANEMEVEAFGKTKTLEEWETTSNEWRGAWTRQSILGRVGKTIEPMVKPLGWDWRIGMAAIASFPAREVMVGTLGIIFNQGTGEADDESYTSGLSDALREARWDNDPARPIFSVPVAMSVLVFFALCCQCASTLAIIRRETNSWAWPAFTFVYMTTLAYLGALVTYQIGALFL